jgi:ribosomal protein S15P/S13E
MRTLEEIQKGLLVGQVTATRTLRSKSGDIITSIIGEWGSDTNKLSLKEVQVAYLLVSREADIGALRSQYAKGLVDAIEFETQLQSMKYRYEEQIKEISK